MEQYNIDKARNPVKVKMVRCLICGATFEASLDKCPVCGVGPEYFEPYEEEETTYRKDTDEVFVILGNGAAGLSAAEAIRERNGTCTVIMVSDEPYLSYNRPMLTKSLESLKNAEEIAIHDSEWYEKNKITNILGVRAVKLDTAAKTVMLGDGRLLKYDKCIYALGSECFIPPITGADKPEVIAVRRMDDVLRIRALSGKVKNTVVIGGGVLGLEAAWGMHRGGSRVTVLEVADKLMVRQLDDAGGELLANIIVEAGIDFRINAAITEVIGDGSVTGVKLEDGTVYPADLVIISAGVRANTAAAKEAGINAERSVIVNEWMETNAPGVYACGDCAQFNGVNYAIWPQALEMGRIAGANAAGDKVSYKPVPATLTFEGMNTTLFAAGDNGRTPGVHYKTAEVRDPAQKVYEKYHFNDDGLAGVILIGDTSRLAELTLALNEKRKYGGLKL
jgi:NAD(P)H-nitrite reductase large subunit